MGEIWEETERVKLYIQEALLVDKAKYNALIKAMKALDQLTLRLKKVKDNEKNSTF